MLRRRALPFVALALVTGCGGHGSPAASQPARPLSAQSLQTSVVERVTPADYAAPLATYRRHVRRELGHMLGDVGALRRAADAGRLAAARAAWLRAAARYGRIGAAYGAFGDLDAAINGRPDGLPGGIRSPDFTGLHRIELALWAHRSPREVAPYARRLAVDVARLRARVAKLEIEPLDYALRVHEILEDALHLELSGQAARWSGSALTSLRSEVAGTRVVLDTLRPLLARRDPSGAVRQSDQALARLSRALRRLDRRDGSLPRWDTLGQRSREEINGLTAGAAEHLAYLPELVDPRPPRPRQASLEASR
jgi:iron uptake system EfeUOB component EfeO/EfeM